MDDFLSWLSNNPAVTVTIVVAFAALVATIILIFGVAFFQGRSVSLWPPQIGENPTKMAAKQKRNNKGGRQPVTFGEVRVFPDGQSRYEYIIKRIKEAQRSVDDITWLITDEDDPTPAAQMAYKEYINTIATACLSKPTMAYREIMCFPPLEYLDRATKMLESNIPGYRLKYFESNIEWPPLLEFMIIDGEEVIFGFYRSKETPLEREIRIAIHHSDVARLYQDYYDVLWQSARPLDIKQVAELKKRLSKT